MTQGIADGIAALRLLVVVGLAVDAASVLWDMQLLDDGWSGAAVTAGQLVLSTAAAAAVMWLRPRLAVVLCTLVFLLALTVGSTSEELWLLLVVAVTVGAHASGRVVAAVALAELGYVVLFALGVQQRTGGWGVQAAAVSAIFCLTGFAAGLAVRRSRQVLERRQRRLVELEQENAQIRTTERLRLAEDLQAVVTGGLTTIRGQLDLLADRTEDATALRSGLTEIDQESRSVLHELRSLLEVLRRDSGPVTGPAVPAAARPRRSLDVLTARHVRLAAMGVFAVLAVRAALDDAAGLLSPAATVQLLGWAACAVAVVRSRAGAVVAATGICVSLATGTPSGWSVLPAIVLFFLASLGTGVRRLWVVLLLLLGYGALLVVTVPEWAVPLTTTAYAGVVGIIGGLAAGHFRDAGRDSARRHTRLLDDREGLEAEERTAVARELHDVVAHQLSLTNLSIMATSASTDPAALSRTLHRVAENVEAAERELVQLLQAMRGAETDHVQTTPLVLPSVGTQTLARRLEANGFQPVVDLDPAADELDVTTMRTLGRVMQEATTNILRYAPAGSTCRYALTVGEDRVQLDVVSPMPVREHRSALSLGWGLRGIAERVELSQGTFHAGPRRGSWVVEVTLPRDQARDLVTATQLAG